ncbi:NUDIX hydrolase [Virgibacillus doumboii]|uniref:NUDIX hydrolase n=1 Tax=Virgibacillus doumboii TaxID=2697503 RepID=UPI0013E09839|nr:NUDIX hydrolase [Virgibacillus doumboii]
MDATFDVKNAVFNYRTAAVMIVNGHVLIHRQANDGHWALPGGRVKMMENSASTVVREVKEELGFDVKVDRLLWITENFFTYNERDFHEIGLYYSVSGVAEELALRDGPFYGEEGDRLIYQWVPLDELDDIVLYPEFLKESLKRIPEQPEHVVVRDIYDIK